MSKTATADARRMRPRLSLTLPADLREAADALAEERRISLSRLIEDVLRAELARARKKDRRGA